MAEVPDSVRQMFLAAGWYPGRQTVVSFDRVENLRSYPLASELLQTFGGLRVGDCGPGRDWGTSDIYFTIKPSADERDVVAELESPGDDLFPLGAAHREHLELFLDTQGRLLVYTIPDGHLCVAGSSFWAGVERLLLGHKWPT